MNNNKNTVEESGTFSNGKIKFFDRVKLLYKFFVMPTVFKNCIYKSISDLQKFVDIERR